MLLTPKQRDAKVAINEDETAPSPTWHLSTKSNAQDLFAERPTQLVLGGAKIKQPRPVLIVLMKQPQADGQPDGKVAPVPVTLTLKGKRQSYEITVDLDAASNP